MDAEKLEDVCKNGFMRSIYLMTDSPLTFEKLLELPPKCRLKALEKVAGQRKINMDDLIEFDQKITGKKKLAQLQLFN